MSDYELDNAIAWDSEADAKSDELAEQESAPQSVTKQEIKEC